MLYYRSNACQLFHIFHWTLFLAIGRANFAESAKYMEEGGDFDKEVAEAIFPVAKWAHIIGTLGRIVLLAVSYKKPRICRMYFFYEMMMMLIDQCLPRDIKLDILNFLLLLLTTINYFSLAFDFWPNLIACSIS